MDEQNYMILELPGPGSRDVSSQAGPLVAVERLTADDARDAARAPGRCVLPEVPLRLIRPVSSSDSDAAGEAWGVEAVGALATTYTGAGIKVAVLDTGIDASHEAFAGLKVTQRDFTGEGDGDADGHGTHCAGTIAGRSVGGRRIGVAPGIDELLVGKVIGAEGGTNRSLMEGLQWALQQGADLVSMSLTIDFPGMVEHWTALGLEVQPATSRALEGYRENLALFSSLTDVLRLAGSALIVAATGNESRRTAANPYTIGVAPPAGADDIVAVGALDRALKVAGFSNTGANVAAPGVDVLSATAGGGLGLMSGTSMATPHVVGVAALWAERLLTDYDEVSYNVLKTRVLAAAELPGKPLDVGNGIVVAPPPRA